MPGWYEKNYWKTGFKSRLYDFLTPEAYFESMRRTVALIPEKKEGKIWDAGCGSGLLLVFLKNALKGGMNYFGTDLLFSGLEKAKLRAREFEISERVTCFQNDLSGTPPFNENSMDIIIAHFSLYTIFDDDKRLQALKNMFQVLKTGGMLIATCPSKNYDADKIIKNSLELVRVNKGISNAMIKRFIFYPLTKNLGLSFIQKQLESGKWIAYTLEGFQEELRQAGFNTGPSKPVYAEGAYLLCGHKSS